MNNTKIEQYKILAGVIVAQLALLYFILNSTIITWAIAFFVYFLMLGLGISLLNHRALSHKTIEIKSKAIRHFLLFWSTVALQGSSLAWVGMHREHHAYSDTEKDPHSPLDSFWKSYWLSMMHKPNIRFIKDLLRNNEVQDYHRHYWKINIAYSVILFAIFGVEGVLVGHLVPAALTWHASAIVNAVAHAPIKLPKFIAYRNYETNELSKNIPLAGYLTFGEAWHNNHHGMPTNPSFKKNWWEWDLVGQIAKLFYR